MNHDSQQIQAPSSDSETDDYASPVMRTSPGARVPGVGYIAVMGVFALLLAETAVRCTLWLAATLLHTTLPLYAVRLAKISTGAFTLSMLLIYRIQFAVQRDRARIAASSYDADLPDPGPEATSQEPRIANR